MVAISRTYRIAIDLNYIPLMPSYLPFLISRASAIVTVVRRLCIPPLIGGGRYVSSTSYTIKSHLSLPFLLSLHVLSYQSVTRDFKQWEWGRWWGRQALRENPNNHLRMTSGKNFDILRSAPTWNESLWHWLKMWVFFFAFSPI